MESALLPYPRVGEDVLNIQLESVSRNPVVDELLRSVGGLFAVLNESRQILALNDALSDFLGWKDASAVLGLRPGEALRCLHAGEKPEGCGTTSFCETCGAAIAMAVSLTQDRPVERSCVLQADRSGGRTDAMLRVRSSPLAYDRGRLLLLFIQDVTREQQRALLERAFFHDILNTATGLSGLCELLSLKKTDGDGGIARRLHRLAERMVQEIEIQRLFAGTESESQFKPVHQRISILEILSDVESVFTLHPVTRGRLLRIAPPPKDEQVETNPALLLRLLVNMVVNALEATNEGDEARVWVEREANSVTFCVWNRPAIPTGVALRIFQRNFSTKAALGRGFGTFSLKWIGERLLGARVDFASSEKQGTTFRLKLPS